MERKIEKMSYGIRLKHIKSLLFLNLFLVLCPLQAKDFYGYTQSNPLVIVCDWDFRPFEFQDSEGKPSGYNVEVLEKILDDLDIPYKFVMQEWHEATTMFERQEADLIHALSFYYKRRPFVSTQKYVNYYVVKAARHIKTPPLCRLADIGINDTLMVKRDDYVALRLQDMNDKTFSVRYSSPKEGLTAVRNRQYPYFVWGEIPLNRKIQELHLDSLVLDDIDIPAGELRVIGYDKAIIDIIDDQYTRLEQAGELQNIYDKWFHPDRIHDDTSPVAVFILIGLAIVMLGAFLLTRLTRSRVKEAIRRNDDLNQMMIQALNMGEIFVVEWDIEGNLLRNRYGAMLPAGGMLPQDFLNRLTPGQAEAFHAINMGLINGKNDYNGIRLRLNRGDGGQDDWRDLVGNAIVEREAGKVRYIVYSARDITRQLEEERYNQMMGSRYMKIFDTNLMAMSFYSADGHLINLNKKMRELCEFNEDTERYFRQTLLFEDPVLKSDFNPNTTDSFHVCRHLYFPSLGIDKQIETRILPVINDEQRLVYYVVTARDVTQERVMYMRQREHNRQLQRANDTISHYEHQLHYLLAESDMYVWEFNLQEQRINYMRTLSQPEFSETREEYIAMITESQRAEAAHIMHEAILKEESFTAIHLFDTTPVNPVPTRYFISGMPLRDKVGAVNKYFGIARNITALMQAQQQLREERLRAEDSGRMKAAFLANMTHEIRTPLNAIVGFSGLLQVVETDEERREFIRIIRNNCDMLLRLINDILEASSMGQSLAIEPEAVDLSRVFDDICQTLAQRVQEPGVEFQKDNPFDTCPAVLDKGRLQQLLTNFVTNAVKYTHEGHIRVGYREMMRNETEQGLYFYCEDTGTGIPKEKQDSVFKRFVKLNDFVQGTGLGLSICKAIVEKCGGEIGVTGDVGIGSTFWFWIPREMKDLEKA